MPGFCNLKESVFWEMPYRYSSLTQFNGAGVFGDALRILIRCDHTPAKTEGCVNAFSISLCANVLCIYGLKSQMCWVGSSPVMWVAEATPQPAEIIQVRRTFSIHSIIPLFHHSSHAKSIPAKQTCPATTLAGSRPFRQFPIQSLGINLEDLSSLFAVAPGFF